MTNYVLNEEKMFADVTDGIAIIINSESGIYYGMNSFGTAVYENIVNGASIESILMFIKSFSEFSSNIETNFKNFVQALIDKEIIIESNSDNSDVDISLEIAKKDGFEMEIREYNDAQELLLADPIHEVKEEEGWSPEKSSLIEDKEEVARKEAKIEQ